MKLKISILLLCTAMLVGSLSGCTGSQLREFSGTGEDTETSGDVTETSTRDFTNAYNAYSADELFMTINDLPVYWGEYFYWLQYATNTYEQENGTITDWNAQSADGTGETVSEYVMNYAKDMVIQYRALESNAARLGVTLTEEDRTQIEETWQQEVDTYGSGDEAAFLEYLSEQYVTKELYDYFNEVSFLYYNIFSTIYGESGELCSDEDTLNYATENGYMRAKHILISTVDAEGNALPDEELATKKALAEDIVAQLNAAGTTEEKISLFENLMNEYGEDPGLAYYPGGYCFTSGKMVQEFEDATLALKDNEISGIVETTYGYHIILRLPLTPDSIVEYYSEDSQYDLRYVASVDMYYSLVNSWFEEAETVSSDALNSFDVVKAFE